MTTVATRAPRGSGTLSRMWRSGLIVVGICVAAIAAGFAIVSRASGWTLAIEVVGALAGVAMALRLLDMPASRR